MSRRTLVSIHDVMPRTLDDVRAQLALLRRHGVAQATLLVVPGRDWRPVDIDQLRAWQDAGHELAGHGWSHRALHVRGIRHRVYARLVSRDCAEHLALTAPKIMALLHRNRHWFDRQGLAPPQLYVPPAWALGALPVSDYAAAGFRMVEDLRGIHDLQSGQRLTVPAVGFEAINRLRALALKASNGLNRMLAGSSGLLRLALHPKDLRLFLHEDVERALGRLGETCLYRDLPEGATRPATAHRNAA